MATQRFETRDSKLALACKKAQIAGDHVQLAISDDKEVAGLVVDVWLKPETGMWEITITSLLPGLSQFGIRTD
jgi:hypothetical protein